MKSPLKLLHRLVSLSVSLFGGIYGRLVYKEPPLRGVSSQRHSHFQWVSRSLATFLRFTIFTSLAHSVHGPAHSLTVECINVCVHASQEQKSRHNETESKPFLTLDRQNDLVSAKIKMRFSFFFFFSRERKWVDLMVPM